MRAILSAALAGGLIAGAAIAACNVGDVSFDGKTCPCGTGWTCDPRTNACVRPGALTISPEASVGPTDGGGGRPDGCRGDTCPCVGDQDCVDPARPRCSPSKICVECLPGTGDTCRAGSYCNTANQCTLGCKQESDCQISPAAPHCDTGRHQCVACRSIADCTGADQCSPSGECVEGCDLAQGKLCPAGKDCCGGLCLNTKTDPLNCGACGTACSTQNATPSCAGGACNFACANGFGHCVVGNTGCETNLRSDPLNCNACGRACAPLLVNTSDASCAVGVCGYGSCNAGFVDCNGNTEDGCECVCGQARGQPCCPGKICNFAGANCNGANKCI